jgi:hypothetical protein
VALGFAAVGIDGVVQPLRRRMLKVHRLSRTIPLPQGALSAPQFLTGSRSPAESRTVLVQEPAMPIPFG